MNSVEKKEGGNELSLYFFSLFILIINIVVVVNI